MEKFTYKKIQLKQLNPNPVYSVRFAPEAVPQPLLASIARQGALLPLVVTCDSEPRIISGYRRHAALLSQGKQEASVLMLNQAVSPKEAFLSAIVSNWQTDWTDTDRAYALGRAVGEFGFTPSEAQEMLMPAMGLEPHKHLLEEYCETAKLGKNLLQALQDEKLPYRGARHLARLSAADQEDFAQLIAARAALTAQDLQRILEWIRARMRQTGESLRGVVSSSGAESVLGHPTWDRRIKGEKLCQILRELAQPALSAQEKRFAEALKSVGDFSGDFRVEAPPFFEEQGYQLRAKLKSKADLARYRALLEKHGEWLNSLFDFML